MATSLTSLTSLTDKLVDPGFTPSIRALSELLDLLSTTEDEDIATAAERAVLRIEAQYAARVVKETLERFSKATRPARGRLTHLVGRLASDGKNRDPDGLAVPFLIEALADSDPKTRRSAARALGKVPKPSAEISAEIEAALAAAFDRGDEADKRASAIALGKIGGEAAQSRLADGTHGRASIIIARDAARRSGEPGAAAIDLTGTSNESLRVWFHVRSGLEDIVKEELNAKAQGTPSFVAPGIVEGRLDPGRPLSSAIGIRTAMHIGFPLAPFAKGGSSGSSSSSSSSSSIEEDIVRGITSPEAMRIFRGFTSKTAARGDAPPIRFRIAFARGGHRRGVVWKCAELVAKQTRELVNDPQESTWEVNVNDVGERIAIELVPRGFTDARFAYRQDLVAASSHPTIAAALVRVAPRRDDDVMWDPFAGAGAELVERAMLGPYERLLGTDTDAKAVDAARKNVQRAGLERVTIEQADGSTYSPPRDGGGGIATITLMVTNPPMGRRVQRGEHGDLLERFVRHAARVLAPGGSLVWMVPEPPRIRAAAERAGLDLVRAVAVDMGGFSAELSHFEKGRKAGLKKASSVAARTKTREKARRTSRGRPPR